MIKLTNNEIGKISGGDAYHDIGYAIGYGVGAFVNTANEIGDWMGGVFSDAMEDAEYALWDYSFRGP